MKTSVINILEIIGYLFAAITILIIPMIFLLKIPIFINPIVTGLGGNFVGAILYYSKDEKAKRISQRIIWANIISIIIGIISFLFLRVFSFVR